MANWVFIGCLSAVSVCIILHIPICTGQFALSAPWSVCNNSQMCMTTPASDDCSFAWRIPNPTRVNVQGLFIFFAEGWHGGANDTGLAEFVFMERFQQESYQLTETASKITCLKRMGRDDYREPCLTLVMELSLISDSANRYSESVGSVESCLSGYPIKSIAINGAERWEIVGRNGTSVCIQVEDTFSYVPGIIRDTRTLGFDHESRNICAVIRGCSKPLGDIIRIPNNETSGVLRRP